MVVAERRGMILGAGNYLAYAYISTPIVITAEGANILTRNLIIFGQGAIRCHPFKMAGVWVAWKTSTQGLDP